MELFLLVIDYRERSLFDRLSRKVSEIESRNLHLGDIQFIQKTPDGREYIRMILERKTIKDLAASIKDGRYLEQKKRLLAFRQENPEVRLGYLLEGVYSFDPRFSVSNIGNKTLSGAIINSSLRDNFTIWFSENENESDYFLENLYNRFKNDPQKYFDSHESLNIANKDYNEDYVCAAVTTHTKKKENMNPKMCLIIQLSCIPGVSGKKAQDIVDTLKINSLFELGILLKRQEDENKNVTGKRKTNNILTSVNGIGPKLADVIEKYILNK